MTIEQFVDDRYRIWPSAMRYKMVALNRKPQNRGELLASLQQVAAVIG